MQQSTCSLSYLSIVSVGETSVIIAASSEHRQAAMEAVECEGVSRHLEEGLMLQVECIIFYFAHADGERDCIIFYLDQRLC